ncbi:MAG: tRNA (adenosine(37)-N6)-dimethylallyltransferase MiaA [Burkholderiales bacterium]|nr:MAG: tRNA (adenosine(37)-N6)-dimethylallyltransferase MiaA [Burkholderiales bacterium]TAG78619.1 MAG: tRNA (adenosine(37)-N6)-dimethylallyltransferase MiaA [Betaproteobacteria bacterium]
MKPPVILLIGPTASGKTAAALQLAERFNAEIVSVDSALVYRDMNIGTAKPSAEEKARVPHHLIDLIDPTERYSVAQFLHDAMAAIRDIQSRGRMPLLVGGTMLYANALLVGMSDVPPTDDVIRAQVNAEIASHGIEALHAKLRTVDPETAQRLAPADAQRIGRAYEVFLQTGQPLSSMQSQRKCALSEVAHFVIRWQPQDRAWLHARCEERLRTMFDSGFVDEVKSLTTKYSLTPDMSSMRCVGYRQVLDVLRGRAPENEMFDRALFATRQLAKRQLTWLRSLPGEIVYCDAVDAVARATVLVQERLGR